MGSGFIEGDLFDIKYFHICFEPSVNTASYYSKSNHTEYITCTYYCWIAWLWCAILNTSKYILASISRYDRNIVVSIRYDWKIEIEKNNCSTMRTVIYSSSYFY